MAGTKSNNPTIIILKAINADMVTLPIMRIDFIKVGYKYNRAEAIIKNAENSGFPI